MYHVMKENVLTYKMVKMLSEPHAHQANETNFPQNEKNVILSVKYLKSLNKNQLSRWFIYTSFTY